LKKMKIKFSLLLLLSFTLAFAQKQAYFWHFGDGTAAVGEPTISHK
jgi:hypothetical protein